MSTEKAEPELTNLTPATDPPPATPIEDPNTLAIVQLIDKLNGFVTQSANLRTTLQQSLPDVNLATMDMTTLQQKINLEPANSTIRPLLQQYQTMREEFDKVKSTILTKASESFGLDGSDYLVAPLGELLDQIQTGHVDTNFAVEQLNKLIRTIGIGKAISYSRMIPYVGAVIYGVVKGLDSYTATQVVLGKFLTLLENLGVDKTQLALIRNYITQKTFVTENYEAFQKWLANGAPMTAITETLSNTKQQLSNQFSHFFVPPTQLRAPSQIGSPDAATTTESNAVGGGMEEKNVWVSVTLQRQNKRTRKYIQDIHQTIKHHLSRLRGRRRSTLRRTPFHKSIASFKIKRGF